MVDGRETITNDGMVTVADEFIKWNEREDEGKRWVRKRREGVFMLLNIMY